MEQRSSEGVAGEWREQGVSGHALFRASIGAASRGAPLRVPAQAPFVSFVVPLYNHLEQTQAMLDSLQASLPAHLDYEIILVDDASTDGTREWLQQWHAPRMRKILNPHNLGYAGANNAGVALARGELLGLLNNDLMFEPGWLEPMLDALLAPGLNAGLVGNLQFRVADGALDHAGVRLNAAAQFEHLQNLSPSATACTRVLAVTGACVLMRKADFEAVGGFDGRYANGGEDIDLCFKLRAAGKPIFLAGDSRIRHHVSLSRKTNTLQDTRNSRVLFARWRQEIKQELSEVWRTLLAAGPYAYADKLSGELDADFLRTPHLAARVIAEAMLRREEARWARDLGDADPNVGLAERVTVRGLRYSPLQGGYLLRGEAAEFEVDGLRCARNFCVCGRRIDDLTPPMALTIGVNGLQTQTFPLKAERHLNVGIIDPLPLPGMASRFRVAVNFVGVDGPRQGTAGESLVLTHLVIDEQVVALCA
jgi:GT2 family glycosyltransferase